MLLLDEKPVPHSSKRSEERRGKSSPGSQSEFSKNPQQSRGFFVRIPLSWCISGPTFPESMRCLSLLPHIIPHPYIVDDNVQEDDIGKNRDNEWYQNNVENLISMSFRLIEWTNPFLSEIQYKRKSEKKQSNTSKRPFPLSIEYVCQSSGKRDGSQSENNQQKWTQTTQARCHHRNGRNFEYFFEFHAESIREGY